MSDFNVHSISGFLAVGKRYSVDIKLHGMGISTVLAQIDEPSLEGFITQWTSAQADIVRCVNAFFGSTLQARIPSANGHPVTVSIDDRLQTDYMLSEDRHALYMLNYAMNIETHESMFETLGAIAQFVRTVNVS